MISKDKSSMRRKTLQDHRLATAIVPHMDRAPGDELITDYLIRARRVSRRLPRRRREWVIAMVGDRIAAALETSESSAQETGADAQTSSAVEIGADPHTSGAGETGGPRPGDGGPGERDVAAVLAMVGEPADVVRAVDGHTPGGEAGWMELGAVVLLVIGGLAFLPAWATGVMLLWASPRWQREDKLLGTFVWPGGLTLFRYFLYAPSLLHPFRRAWYAYPALTTRFYNPLVTSPRYVLTLVALGVLGAVQTLVAIRLARRARLPEPPVRGGG